MRGFRIATLTMALGLGVGLAGAVQAQTVGFNVRSGDVWVDSRLGEINYYGQQYRDPFLNEMSTHYGAPRPFLVELLDQRRWAPADVYYACAIARAAGVPCQDVVRDYDRNPGQGWGAIAKRHGIKPGSPAFHAMKRGTVATYDRWGYPIAVDRNTWVDWSRHGPDGKGRDARGGPGHGGKPMQARGNPGQGKGAAASGKGQGPGKAQGPGKGQGPGSKGQGSGKGKGSDKGKGNGKGNG